jgi:translation initiation factor IF-2
VWNNGDATDVRDDTPKIIAMDITRPEGRDLFLRLVELSDGFVENNAPGLLERFDIGPDVLLASASNAIIIGFNVRPERKAQELAEQEKVDIRLHSIIYELQDEIKRAMTGLLEPTIKETYQGRAIVQETFRIPKVGTIAGCRVSDGLIKRDSEVRLLRDNVVVFTGKISSLRRFKDDAKEVTNGMECGIAHVCGRAAGLGELTR